MTQTTAHDQMSQTTRETPHLRVKRELVFATAFLLDVLALRDGRDAVIAHEVDAQAPPAVGRAGDDVGALRFLRYRVLARVAARVLHKNTHGGVHRVDQPPLDAFRAIVVVAIGNERGRETVALATRARPR